MIIYGVAGSPFCQKVWLATLVAGLQDRISLGGIDLASKEDRALLANPLSKVPVLKTPDGRAVYDSVVIVEVLDDLSGGKLIGHGADRYLLLTAQALADGILEAASLQVQEKRFHPQEGQSEKWLAFQAGKAARGLAELEGNPPSIGGSGPRIDAIAVACVLGYMDLRFEGRWREEHPRLCDFLREFEAAVPAYAATGRASVFGAMP
ncbi:MAG: glutathione S-transferase family protein [Mesorhizobium sp.]